MAVPKEKISKSRRRTRSSHNFKAPKITLTTCPQCKSPVEPHRVCRECGFYNGVKRIETKADRAEAKAKAAAAKNPAAPQ
ncbi:MAG: 50S ribosomal protein L32 [Christensenellaceae bacterium]|jgi:large subunit ribosomal protein L32|nr:50S ribosomal protein L32 [Christensenellaceae bacterium]